MEKAAHQFKLFILFVLETMMTIQINAVSSALPRLAESTAHYANSKR